MRRSRKPAAMVLAAALALAGCGGAQGSGGSKAGGGGEQSVLTIANTSGSQWTCGFNPFNPATNGLSGGFIYETLMHVNTLQNAKVTPMLATKFTWSSDHRTLTFDIRDGVKWSDGKPFSAKDVAFTFNLLKTKPGLDLNAVWSTLASVTAKDKQVVMTFKQPSEPDFYFVAGQVFIVPEHVWSTGAAAKDPVQYPDAKPVGTGPYTMGGCKPANITYQANPSFWQPGLPKVKTVHYPAYTDNDPANLDLATGKAQWGGQYIPSVDKYYVSKDKEHNHYWYPPVSNVELIFNLKRPVSGNTKIRQAISYGIDRADVSKVAVQGYNPPANQTGVVLPTFKDWYNQAAADKYKYEYNPTKAKQLLAEAGYNESKKLKLTVITTAGFTDWDASLQEMKQQLAKVNVELNVSDLAGQTYNSKLYTGDYDVAYGSSQGGPNPYYELRRLLYTGNTAPIGKAANSNYSRYSNPKVDQLLESFGGADEAKQKEIVKQVQEYMLSDVPVVPVVEAVNWFQYSTKDFTGWPTEKDPYALPAPYSIPDVEQVLLKLTPAK